MKTRQSLPTFESALRRRLRFYRFVLPSCLAIVMGFAASALVVTHQALSDRQLSSSLRDQIASLVQINDGSELLRLATSVAKGAEARVEIVKNGFVVATSGDIETIQRAYVPPSSFLRIGHFQISSEGIILSNPVDRNDGGHQISIIFDRPILPTLQIASLAFLFALILGFAIAEFYARKFSAAARATLQPIEKLEASIRSLAYTFDDLEAQKFDVLELESIRASVLDAHKSLEDANVRAAGAKANQLASDSFQKLIHDLYAPIASLREVTKKLALTESEQSRDQLRATRLAEQILNQITVAKSSIGMNPTLLVESDLRSCVSEAIEQAIYAQPKSSSLTFEINFPDNELRIPHDSDYLRRAVVNLVSNAIEASRSRVEINLSKVDSNVLIRVEDDGHGIPEGEVSLLLQGRLLEGRNRRGFGLPIANHVARLHGGRLIYRDLEGRGTAFEMRL